MHVPEIHKQRKKISGLKMPRQYTPRLPGASVKGQAPVNPFLGNKMKVASLTSFREAQLIKTASAEDAHLYYEMCKLADTGDELQIRMFLAQHPEMEKDAGIIGHGFRLLSKALGKGGAMTGSAKLTQMSGQAAKKSQKSFQAAASKLNNAAVPSTMTGLNANIAKQQQYQAAATAQKQVAKTQGQAANRVKETKQLRRDIRAGTAADVPTPVAVKPPPGKTAPATGAPAGGAATKTAPAGGAAQNFGNMSDDALKAAAEGGDEAAKRALAKRLGNPVEAAASPLIANSTLGKAIVGTGAVGGLGAVGYGGYKANQRGRQQNLQQQGRGFNYGM